MLVCTLFLIFSLLFRGGVNFHPAPAGVFVQVTSYRRSTCALRADGAVICLGDANAYLEITSMKFSHVATGPFACGISASAGTIHCFVLWSGQPVVLPAAFTSSSFVDVAAGEGHVCGIQSTGYVTCHCVNPYYLDACALPARQFSALALGSLFSCGILSETSSMLCVGQDPYGQALRWIPAPFCKSRPAAPRRAAFARTPVCSASASFMVFRQHCLSPSLWDKRSHAAFAQMTHYRVGARWRTKCFPRPRATFLRLPVVGLTAAL